MSEKKLQEPIDNFNGYFEFLNNDFPAWVHLDGQLYPSVTTAYQASRTDDKQLRRKINEAETFEQLAEIATKIKNPADWSSRRYKTMEALVRDKFRRNKAIREKLIETGTRRLINRYPKGGDNETYWGLVSQQGLNNLGKILENVRDEISRGVDCERWLTNSFQLERNVKMVPKVTLRVEKDGQAIDKLQLQGKTHYTFGTVKGNDFRLDHLSISRNHCCIFTDSAGRVCVIDIGSSAGTFLNSTKIESFLPQPLQPGDILIFGMSTRKYVVLIDRKEVDEYTQQRANQLKKELAEIQVLKQKPGQLTNQQIRSKLGFRISDCILVENVPPYTSVRKLRDLFDEYGRVKNVNIFVDPSTGKEVGVAVICFHHQKEAQEIVIKRLKFEIGGRQLVLKLLDQFEATKLIESYSSADSREHKREHRDRSRSREKDHHRRRD